MAKTITLTISTVFTFTAKDFDADDFLIRLYNEAIEADDEAKITSIDDADSDVLKEVVREYIASDLENMIDFRELDETNVEVAVTDDGAPAATTEQPQ